MKNLTITPPEGYEIDKEQSTFENIVFKPLPQENSLPETWEQLETITGYSVGIMSEIHLISCVSTSKRNKNAFATKEQAEASIALAQLSQLMAVYNDGWVPDWTDHNLKYVIHFTGAADLIKSSYQYSQHFLRFKTRELRNEFLKNFRDLILTAKPLL
jgi:hypothetical protein